MFSQVQLSLFIGTDDCDMSDLLSECSELSDISDFEDQCSSLNIDLSNGSPINTNNFIIVQYNVNSILADGRIEQLSDNCN